MRGFASAGLSVLNRPLNFSRKVRMTATAIGILAEVPFALLRLPLSAANMCFSDPSKRELQLTWRQDTPMNLRAPPRIGTLSARAFIVHDRTSHVPVPVLAGCLCLHKTTGAHERAPSPQICNWEDEGQNACREPRRCPRSGRHAPTRSESSGLPLQIVRQRLGCGRPYYHWSGC